MEKILVFCFLFSIFGASWGVPPDLKMTVTGRLPEKNMTRVMLRVAGYGHVENIGILVHPKDDHNFKLIRTLAKSEYLKRLAHDYSRPKTSEEIVP